MQNQTVSHQKIISIVVFIAAAIMVSLFIYHAKNKQPAVNLANGQGLIFPAAKSIAPFELTTTDGTSFTNKNFYHHWTLLYFGFTHCNSFCPATLDMLKKAYPTLIAKYPNLQVAMISLDPIRDNRAALAKFMQKYNANFIGASGKIEDLRKLQSQLGVYAEDANTGGADYQLQHTASILLINPRGQWAGIFKFGMSPKEFIQAFDQSMTSLSA